LLLIRPDYEPAHRQLGMILFDTNQLELAMMHLEESNRLLPNHTEIMVMLGTVAAHQGRMDVAMDMVTQLRSLKQEKSAQDLQITIMKQKFFQNQSPSDSVPAG
jgi:Flp pilus assembly protein TadD